MTRDRDATAAVAAVREAERLARRESRKAGPPDFGAAELAMRRLAPGGARDADEVSALVDRLDLSR